MKSVVVGAIITLLFAAGTYAATVVTELHPYSKTYTDAVTVVSKGKTTVIPVTGTVSGTITDQDTYPDPVTVTQTVTVTGGTTTAPPADNTPVASFSYQPQNPIEGQPVAFDGRSSVCQDAPCTYVWQDDGPDGPGGTQWPLGTGAQISFTFNNCPCTINARLIVTDADGDVNSAMQTIQVADSTAPPPPPPPSGSVAPGQSWQTAYDAAPANGIIRVLAGNHGRQVITGSKPVTFLGDPGNIETQVLDHVTANVTFDGLHIDADGIKRGAESALFENSGNPFVFKNGSIGDTFEQKSALIDGADAVFDNVRFHDVNQGGGTAHVECIQAVWVPNFKLVNSTFTNCGIMGLSLGFPTWWSPPPPPYCCVTIENNQFNAPVPSNNYALAIWSNKDSCNDTCGWGVMSNYRIKNNYIWSLINRMTTDSTTVICGNSGPGAPTDWRNPCP